MQGTEERPSIWFYVVAHSAFAILSIITLGYAIRVPSQVSTTAKVGIAYAAVAVCILTDTVVLWFLLLKHSYATLTLLPNCLAIVFLFMSVLWYGKSDLIEDADDPRLTHHARQNVNVLFDLLYATIGTRFATIILAMLWHRRKNDMTQRDIELEAHSRAS